MKTSELVDYLRASGWEVETPIYMPTRANKGGLLLVKHRSSELIFFVGVLCVWSARVRTVNGVDAAIKNALQAIRKVEIPDARTRVVQLSNVLEAFNEDQ